MRSWDTEPEPEVGVLRKSFTRIQALKLKKNTIDLIDVMSNCTLFYYSIHKANLPLLSSGCGWNGAGTRAPCPRGNVDVLYMSM